MRKTVSYESRPFESDPPLPGAWRALAEAIGALLPNDGTRLPDAMRRALESLYGDKAPDLESEL